MSSCVLPGDREGFGTYCGLKSEQLLIASAHQVLGTVLEGVQTSHLMRPHCYS